MRTIKINHNCKSIHPDCYILSYDLYICLLSLLSSVGCKMATGIKSCTYIFEITVGIRKGASEGIERHLGLLICTFLGRSS